MEQIKKFYKGKKVLVTGATGFKGSWLCSWLIELGAKVLGTGFNPNNNDKLFARLDLKKKIKYKTLDVRNFKGLKKLINSFKPQLIFHLAAQPLVYESYLKPFETFNVNFNGTLNILEISRHCKSIRSIIIVTSDKCYDNIGKKKGYSENDKLGGVDPYSASKASAEIITNSYYKSFFSKKNRCGISTVRAGNVIGGGDWSKNRLVPDCIRSLQKKQEIKLRNPDFTRPWQHVLEPLKGYLILAKHQYFYPKKYSSAWNFGSNDSSIVPVKKIAKLIVKYWGSGKVGFKKNNFHEQKILQIKSIKAKKKLKWKQTYNINQSVKVTTEWYYKTNLKDEDAASVTKSQIIKYMMIN